MTTSRLTPWSSGGGGGAEDGHDGHFPVIADDGSDDAKLLVGNYGVYFVHLITLFTTQPTGSGWATFANANYEGVYPQDSDVPNTTVGKFYYNPRSHALRYREGHSGYFYWRSMHTTDTGYPSNFIGHYYSRNAALASAVRRGIPLGGTFTAFTGSLMETATRSNVQVATGVARKWELVQSQESRLRQFRTEVTAKNAAAETLQRHVRHFTLSIPLDEWDDDDDMEILLSTEVVPHRIKTPVRIEASLIKGLTVNTLTDGVAVTNTVPNMSASSDMFIVSIIPQADGGNAQQFGHERLWLGRVSNTKIVMWCSRDGTGWNFASINRLIY